MSTEELSNKPKVTKLVSRDQVVELEFQCAYTCTQAVGFIAIGNSRGACYGLRARKLKQVEKSRRQLLTGAK